MSLESLMADSTELRSFERLAAAAGPVPAIRLCAFFGPTMLHIPTTIAADHPISLLIGAQAADWLAQELGGEKVSVPALEMRALRRAGRMRFHRKLGSSTAAAAADIGVSDRQARNLAKTLLRLEGYPEKLVAD
jgi:hypothetical protein